MLKLPGAINYVVINEAFVGRVAKGFRLTWGLDVAQTSTRYLLRAKVLKSIKLRDLCEILCIL